MLSVLNNSSAAIAISFKTDQKIKSIIEKTFCGIKGYDDRGISSLDAINLINQRATNIELLLWRLTQKQRRSFFI